jgi:glycosyltransferase involved in cell wall biosynthesis
MNVPDPKRLEGWSDRTGRSHSADGFRIAYFGTMSKRLGIDLALKAVASLKDRIPGLQLYLLGDGDDLDEFISLSQRLGIMKHTYFSGKMLPFDQLLDVLETVELVIVPNRRNSATELMLPVKLLECVGLGIPAVVPRLKAIEHYFDKDMVFFFEPDEIESLADAILSAYNHEEERNRRVERARTLLERYGWDTHKYNLIGLYGS